jgi:hypothetical protein
LRGGGGKLSRSSGPRLCCARRKLVSGLFPLFRGCRPLSSVSVGAVGGYAALSLPRLFGSSFQRLLQAGQTVGEGTRGVQTCEQRRQVSDVFFGAAVVKGCPSTASSNMRVISCESVR